MSIYAENVGFISVEWIVYKDVYFPKEVKTYIQIIDFQVQCNML